MKHYLIYMLSQAIGELSGLVTAPNISLGLLIAIQLQLSGLKSELKVKVNALWEHFLGNKDKE